MVGPPSPMSDLVGQMPYLPIMFQCPCLHQNESVIGDLKCSFD